jgi:drug/metabolite transporter (DMT)-like permease
VIRLPRGLRQTLGATRKQEALMSMLWAVFTVLAGAAQTLRNAMQRDLTEKLGVVGATHVRFLFGFPFAVLFLGLMHLLTGDGVPQVTLKALPMVLTAALAQIFGTALMLAAMRTKSFVVAIAYTKTEPVMVALFGLVFLQEHLSLPLGAAIGIATLGVMLTAWPKEGGGFSWQGLAYGLGSAALYAISALAFRAAIHALPTGGFGIRASTILALGLMLQTLILTAWLLATDRVALKAIITNWRPSLQAGFMGAFASQLWFLAFALASAAMVRTLALVEVFYAKVISGRMFKEVPTPREGLGLLLIVVGVGLLLNV